VGADQYLLPHLGAPAGILLDRFVASGAAGVSGRDADDWVLSRLMQPRYVEESTVDDTIFVCTAAGRHRWQIEMMADERRGATALHRQLIRRRLGERFTRLGIDTSTASMAVDSPPEPRLHRRVPAPWNPPPEAKMQLSSPLAAVFAATAVGLVVISASPDPQEGWDWLIAPPHYSAVLAARPKANAGQTVLVGCLPQLPSRLLSISIPRKPSDMLRRRPMRHRSVRSEFPRSTLSRLARRDDMAISPTRRCRTSAFPIARCDSLDRPAARGPRL